MNKRNVVLFRMLCVVSIILLAFISFRYINNYINITGQTNDIIHNEIKTKSNAALLANLDKDEILASKNINESLPVYSVSKIVFLATVSKKLKEENISFDKKIKVTSLIDDINTNGNFSRSGIQSNEVYTVKELYDAVVIPSGNDAAILLAYKIFGTHQNAVDKMNENAKLWQLNDSNFVSTSGLDGSYLNEFGIDANHGKNMMSCLDLYKMVKIINNEYPEIIEAGSKTESYIGNRLLENVNKSLDGLEHGYPGVYGLKTGSNIDDYSNNIVSLKRNENNEVILAISLNSKTRKTLYEDVASIYNVYNTLNDK